MLGAITGLINTSKCEHCEVIETYVDQLFMICRMADLEAQGFRVSIEILESMDRKTMSDSILDLLKGLPNTQLTLPDIQDGLTFLRPNPTQGKPGPLIVIDDALVNYDYLKE